MGKRIAVRYMVFQGTKNGISGFKEYRNDSNCVEPNKPYKNGVCHTIGDELDMLAMVAGFKTRDQFAKEHGGKSWLDDYSENLSRHMKEVLETTGVGWMVNEELVHFYSPPGEFVMWQKKKNKRS
ncbi:hypothetical protein QWY14_07775 [Planococcus sp. N028]|uniref:Uncharacterized protein n=1 Tax=Planococcus shixiaomingii TaxID=3058393 RepID=A0ABT8N1T3_9BACL|nr:hypothetical protein [Planococcus sp. N028]MDN7241688.1 hypothetical protein [Planococcus sp. N028]